MKETVVEVVLKPGLAWLSFRKFLRKTDSSFITHLPIRSVVSQYLRWVSCQLRSVNDCLTNT